MIVGRHREKQRFDKVLSSSESEFLVVYGRRRVGKTYLIREFFQQENCVFLHATGAYKEKLAVQLDNFTQALSKTFFSNAPLSISSWKAAFQLLQQQVEKNVSHKVVIFLDELPWLATKRSGLLSLIDYYWNHYWSASKNVVLIACGSSASWLIKNILYNKGGLHNRVTCEMLIAPFDLSETQEFLNYRKVKLSQRHILLLYMALGGVPYYLKYVEPHLTADQNIQHILFDPQAPLRDEFKKLFSSLFENEKAYLEIINLVAKNKVGVKRAEIESQAKLSSSGGRLTERLDDLCRAGFLIQRTELNQKIGEYYQLIDEFTLFQWHWVIHNKNKNSSPNAWLTMSQSQAFKSWAGYAFESVCQKHVSHILKHLNVESVKSIDSWRFIPSASSEDDGAQIDLVIERNDDAITLCEIKFTQEPFILDKAYAKKLQEKTVIFQSKTRTKKQIFWAMISANGIKPTLYSEELICKVITLENFFNTNPVTSEELE